MKVFTQVKLGEDLYIHSSRRFHVDDDSKRDQIILKLKNIVHGLRKTSCHNWVELLKTGLLELNFKSRKVDAYIFYRGEVIYEIYVDDILL